MARKMTAAGQALLDDVLVIKKGAPAKTWTPEQLLVISVRKQLKKTQPAFSKLLGVPVGTIRDWEQGRKQPDSAAVTLVKVAMTNPEVLEGIAAL
jgi:putative transcriptional regulator